MEYTPSADDIAWFNKMFDSLKINGVWLAPMGFSFKKTGIRRLELQSITAKNRLTLEVILETLERTKAVGRLVGVDVITEGTAESISVWS